MKCQVFKWSKFVQRKYINHNNLRTKTKTNWKFFLKLLQQLILLSNQVLFSQRMLYYLPQKIFDLAKLCFYPNIFTWIHPWYPWQFVAPWLLVFTHMVCMCSCVQSVVVALVTFVKPQCLLSSALVNRAGAKTAANGDH